jgi:hypothetical protein
MKPGDRVMVRVDDNGDHWLYASVITPWESDTGALVMVQHPANPDDGKMRNAKREDIRTKDDLVPLLEEARKLPQGQVHPGAGPERRRWVAHYEQQIEQLS